MDLYVKIVDLLLKLWTFFPRGRFFRTPRTPPGYGPGAGNTLPGETYITVTAALFNWTTRLLTAQCLDQGLLASFQSLASCLSTLSLQLLQVCSKLILMEAPRRIGHEACLQNFASYTAVMRDSGVTCTGLYT